MAADLFADAGLRSAAKPLTVFRAQLIGREEATWEELFAGFTQLKAITFSSSIEFLLRLIDRLDEAEIVFGSENILSKEHLALAQASHTVAAYGFNCWGAAGVRCSNESSRDRCGSGCFAAARATKNYTC
jgi:hypothetical protein